MDKDERPRKKRLNSPFTLLGCGCSLVAVIGLLMIFIFLGVQVYRSRLDVRWVRKDYAQCTRNLRQISIAIASYQEDTHKFPPSLEVLVPHYLDAKYLRCPLEDKGVGKHYEYTTVGNESDPLVSCSNHLQGPVVLEHSLKIRAKHWR
ncbi:MAG: hypothetical protein WCJ56_11230 [bacterium]